MIHGLTECERKRDDSKKTGFKEAGDDDWHCILLFDDESWQNAGKWKSV